MVKDQSSFQETQRNVYPAKQAFKRPLIEVMSSGEYHVSRRSGDAGSKRKDPESNLNGSSSNAKTCFGSPVPMFGGTFPCGSPFYPGPPTPPLEEWTEQETDDGNDVEFVDDDRNFISHEAATKKFQQQGMMLFPCTSPRMEEYLSASSDDDDDDEVRRLMFVNSSTAATANAPSIDSNPNPAKHGPDTRSRTSQRFGQTVQGNMTSSVRGHTTQARDQTNTCGGVQHGRVHKKFRAIDVTSVGNQRPSLNFRKMRKSSFHRKHHRLTDRLSSQIQTSLSTTL